MEEESRDEGVGPSRPMLPSCPRSPSERVNYSHRLNPVNGCGCDGPPGMESRIRFNLCLDFCAVLVPTREEGHLRPDQIGAILINESSDDHLRAMPHECRRGPARQHPHACLSAAPPTEPLCLPAVPDLLESVQVRRQRTRKTMTPNLLIQNRHPVSPWQAPGWVLAAPAWASRICA